MMPVKEAKRLQPNQTELFAQLGSLERSENQMAILEGLLRSVDESKTTVSKRLTAQSRKKYGQFMTPRGVASLLVSTLHLNKARIRILDPGAGAGSLTAALVAHLCSREQKPLAIDVVAFEIDPTLSKTLGQNLLRCQRACSSLGVAFHYTICESDFLAACAGAEQPPEALRQIKKSFDCVIMNPPYTKINSNSQERLLLRRCGIETSNLYAGFMLLGARLLRQGGEFVSITPRSFCNGPYFMPFRKAFLDMMDLRHIHVFETRDEAFSEDDVLQENVIFYALRGNVTESPIEISSSRAGEAAVRHLKVDRDRVIHHGDPQLLIHIPSRDDDDEIRRGLERFNCTLKELGIQVSTGRVVDFRAKEELRKMPVKGSVPLIYPIHFSGGTIRWPLPESRKPNALMKSEATKSLLLPKGTYVLVKRFTAKEEKRRLVAVVLRPDDLPSEFVALENHINFFHCNGSGVGEHLARGLALYLNSMQLDRYYRQFAGHTQVNATDLRALKYPTKMQLERLGKMKLLEAPGAHEIDQLMAQI